MLRAIGDPAAGVSNCPLGPNVKVPVPTVWGVGAPTLAPGTVAVTDQVLAAVLAKAMVTTMGVPSES